MNKRFLSLCLAAVMIFSALAPTVMPVSAEYDNTHTNTGNQRYDIIQIAATQLGYSEEDSGYTKYGDFHGNAYLDWCGYFVSWCARQANVPTSVIAWNGLADPGSFGLTSFTADERLPQSGDLYFRGTAHVGFVYYVDGNTFYTLEGNSGANSGSVVCRALDLYGEDYHFASPNYGGSNNASHTHTLETTNESEHPHKEYTYCTECDYASYTENTKVVDDCTQCIQENCDHTYEAWETTGESQHKRVCSACDLEETGEHDWVDLKVITEASCKEAGSKKQECSVCKTQRTKIIPKTEDHDYGEWKYVNDDYHQRICAFCKGIDTENHAITEETEWQTEEKEHWQECPVCEEKIFLDEHEYGDDCVAPCEVCEYVREEGHLYTEEWSTDDKQHWHACDNCGEKGKLGNHSYSAECDEDCDTCGHVRQVTHTYPTQMTSDATGHWYECEVCGKQDGFQEHAPGPEATEEAAQSCMDCGYELVAKLKHVHSYEPMYSDNVSHWGWCACGDKLEAQVHSWDMASGKCSVCGVESVAETESQNWDFVWLIIGGAVVCTLIVTTCIMVYAHNKRKRREADPYWA